MKTLNIMAITLLLGTLTLGVAATIDEQITAIQNATTQEERVELVNEFKTTLSTLTKEERQEATAKLRESMQGSGEELKLQIRERTRVQDGDQTGELIRNQRMNQNQAASKGMHQSKMGGGTTTVGQGQIGQGQGQGARK